MIGVESLSSLLGFGAGQGVTHGTGWAGSSYWRFQKAGGKPDAPARRGDKDKPAKRTAKK
jgi:hypothetical protein